MFRPRACYFILCCILFFLCSVWYGRVRYYTLTYFGNNFNTTLLFLSLERLALALVERERKKKLRLVNKLEHYYFHKKVLNFDTNMLFIIVVLAL